MSQQPLADCADCRSAGSISNGYCMICGAADSQRSPHPRGQPSSLAAALLARPEPGCSSQLPRPSGATGRSRQGMSVRSW
jgi:hypothetical protein